MADWFRRRSGAPEPSDLPIPPLEMRELVGPTDPAAFDNPGGGLILPGLPAEAYASVLDFGCGCGRLARQLRQQTPPPDAYVGVDIHLGMIRWCREHLASAAFDFRHQDVYAAGHNPAGTDRVAPLPDGPHSLVIAASVFTHLLEDQVGHYLSEIARVLRPDGYFYGTWFFFEKRDYPMLQDFQNALYINVQDPTNAVIFDPEWLRTLARAHGLVITGATMPAVRGFQWQVIMSPEAAGRPEVELPEDTAEVGRVPPPLLRRAPRRFGLEDT